MHFLANAGLIFLTDKLTKTGIWLILGQPRALFLATKISAHLVPFSKGQMGSQSPLGASSKKACNFKANFSHPVFYNPLWPVLYWALTF
jgi:hypothetical protein